MNNIHALRKSAADMRPKNKRLINPGAPAAHPEPVYRCFLPDLTGFTGPRLRRTRAHERVAELLKPV